MQLFITDFQVRGNKISINNLDISYQIQKVLRMKIGDIIFVQTGDIRHKIQITSLLKESLVGDILETIKNTTKQCTGSIAIAMTNKREKIELIVQKLSEIGIKNIYFRPAQRSIIRTRNDKKIERLHKIAKEATEQSRGRHLPKIEFQKNITNIVQNKKIIIFDQSKKHVTQIPKNTANASICIIGPEGGLTQNDYEKIGYNTQIVSLGDSILRTETASIIAGWRLKN